MFKTKFSRLTTAFLVIASASVMLYITAQGGLVWATWILLALVIAANVFTLFSA